MNWVFGIWDNLGIQMGPVSGGLCDLDLDCEAARALAPYFLPDTDCTFGRTSTPEAHRQYISNLWQSAKRSTIDFDDPDPPKGEATETDDDHGVRMLELRVGRVAVKNGVETVIGAVSMCPPSRHPNGELLAWQRNGSPPPATFGCASAAVICTRRSLDLGCPPGPQRTVEL